MKNIKQDNREIKYLTMNKVIKLLGRIELDYINSVKLFNFMGKKHMDNCRNKIIKYSYEKYKQNDKI